jgi:hypothetical protein
MLGKPARELPGDGFVFEPKWDGFRALVFRDDGDVDVRSRHGRPLARYFPEVVEAFRSLAEPSLVVDGEIVVVTPSGFDFAALMSRLHPAASRVERLARETPLAWHEVEAERHAPRRSRSSRERSSRGSNGGATSSGRCSTSRSRFAARRLDGDE